MHSAARLADMNNDEFMALNAAFPRNLIRSDTPVNLLVPVEKADQFQRNLEAGNWDSWQPYAARKGERPANIAKRFDVSLARLTELNQFRLKNGKLVNAQTILVPVKGRGEGARLEEDIPEDAAPASPNPAQHVVQRGETLYGVARRYGVSAAQLTAANPGLDTNLKVNQRIHLPEVNTAGVRDVAYSRQATPIPRPNKSAKSTLYTVKRGDTLHTIAQRFDVKLSEIKSWNPDLKDSGRVQAGQTVIVNKS